MGPDFTRETCFTCRKNPISFHQMSDPDGDSKLNVCHIICEHFWFKEDDLRSAFICKTCWEKVDQFHQFYLDVKKLHEHCEVAPLSMFIKQEEIEVEETQLQENYMQITAENQKQFDIIDCKLEVKEEFDELPKKEKSDEVPHLRKKQKFTRRQPNKLVMKWKNPSLRYPTLEERQAEDDFIKQHTHYICDECNIEFENFRAIKKHQIETHEKAHVECCGNQYRSRSILYQHVQTLLNPEAYKCDICSKSFKSKQAYIRHKEEHHTAEEKLLFKCNRCPKSFIKVELLKRHLTEHETLENETAKCEFCSKCFRNRYRLNEHVRGVHKKPMDFICEVCSKGFYLRAMFLAHHKTHELTAEQLKEQCPVCKKWLKNHPNWLIHVRRHKDGECKCEVCGHVSINTLALKVHMKRNHGPNNKQHVCEQCGSEYKQAFKLKEHVATAHTKEHPYQCKHCEKKFFSSSNLTLHRKKDHPKEWLEDSVCEGVQLKEQCPVCNKWFKSHSNWLQHMRLHKEGERKCKVCGHVSTNMMSLRRHIQSRHAPNRRRHVCEQCGKEYSRTTTLKEHIASAHTGEHLYQCEHCEKKFFSSANMYSHRKKDHPQEWLESFKGRREEIPF